MSDKKTGNEPQSYGSNEEWLTGKTGQTVDRTPQKSDRHDEEFYDSRLPPLSETAESEKRGSGGKK